MRRIGVLTSGGDAPGMNAAIRAVVRTAIYEGIEVYGIERGYEGLIDGEFHKMEVQDVGGILHRGGTVLRTARSDRFMTEAGREKALAMLETFEIDGLVVIGGDGSMHGAAELEKCGVTVMCLPGTIDNDMGYTDYTIGFDTAINTVLSAIGNIRDTSSSHERTTIIEVMGRNCGDIGLHAGVAGGAEMVLIPEIPVDLNALCRKILQGINRGKKHSIIIRAEGVEISSKELSEEIVKRTGLEVKIVVLGYIQRGGSPTARDRMLASRMGYKAVQLLKEDSTSKAIGISGDEIIAYDLSDALDYKSEPDPTLLTIAEVLSI